MANFCKHCGAGISPDAGFCGACGGALGAQQPAAGPSPAAPAKSSPIVKILLICFGLIVLCGLLIGAAVLYMGYKATKIVQRTAEQSGIDLTALSERRQGREYDPCSLLSKDEAQGILELTVTKVERSGSTCNYYIQPAARELPSLDANKSSTKEAETNPNEHARKTGMEELVKTITSSVNDGTTPYLMVEVDSDGASKMAGMKLAMAAMGTSNFEALRGFADEAFMGPMDSILVFSKAGTAVQLDLRQIPKGRERGIEMAKRITSRM